MLCFLGWGCGQGADRGAAISPTMPPNLTPPVRKTLPLGPKPGAAKPAATPAAVASPAALPALVRPAATAAAVAAPEAEADPEIDSEDIIEIVEFAKQVQPTPMAVAGLSDLEAVIGMSESGVLAIMGKPDQKYLRKSSVRWYYSRLEANGAGQKGCPELVLRDNKVTEVMVHPLSEMIDLMVHARLNKGVEPEIRPRMMTFTFDEALKKIVKGSSKKDVRNFWGEPDIKMLGNNGLEIWRYETLIVENGQKKVLDASFEDDIVIELERR